MRTISRLIFCALALSLAGCATYTDVAHLSLGYAQNPGKFSDSRTFKASGLGLDVASSHIAGTMPNGFGIGLSAARLLLPSEDYQAFARKYNHFEVWMPEGDALNEADAQLKMSQLMEAAIIKALPPAYQTKSVEYKDVSVLGIISIQRSMLVDGLHCENWSCLISAPLPTLTAYQWAGKMAKLHEPAAPMIDKRYAYRSVPDIGFAKITKEYTEEGLFAGQWHKIEGMLVPGFDYQQFYMRISGNLPEWVFYYISPMAHDRIFDFKEPYLLNKGVLIPL
jgi:hypothetical protein